MIPRRVFVLLDASLVLAAFVLAYVMVPDLKAARDALVAGVHYLLPASLPFQLDATANMPPLSDMLWLVPLITPAILLALLATDAYGRLRQISRTRLLVAGPFAAVAGLSVAVLVIFSLRLQEWSRFFLLLFTV